VLHDCEAHETLAVACASLARKTSTSQSLNQFQLRPLCRDTPLRVVQANMHACSRVFALLPCTRLRVPDDQYHLSARTRRRVPRARAGLALASVVALSALAIGAGFFARLNFAPMRALGAAQARHASSLRLLSARRRRVAGRTSGRGVCCRRQRGAAPGASRRHGCLRRRSAWAQRTARRVHCGVAWLLRHGVVDGLLAHTRTRTQTRLPFLFLGREAHFQHPPRTR